MDDKFDAIIVGAGLAGSTAAYMLAKAGLEVLIVERGNFAGAKNMTGGRLYAHTLENIIPGFAEEAPLERCITREKISFLTDESAVTVDYQSPAAPEQNARSYSVLRAQFDKWLLEKAEAAGAQVITGIRVDELLCTDTMVRGVRAGDDELEGHVVILADGANSILAEQIGMGTKVTPHHCAVGVKEVLALPEQEISRRFGCQDSEGAAWLFAGTPSCGQMGGGFLYTNKDSISLGVVFGLHNIDQVGKSVPQMLEDFKNHPSVRPLLTDAALVEYSAHIVPEGGQNMLPKLFGNGVLVTGDAAGFCLNVGYTVRGMDLAIESGKAAAKAVMQAKLKQDYSESSLAAYRSLLEDGPVLKDMHLYRNMPSFVDNPRIFSAYPAMLTGLMQDVFTVNGPATSIRGKLLRRVRQVGVVNLMKDGFKGLGAL